MWDTTSGERRLVAAMYMLDAGHALEDVPNFGGNLMQWHIHNNLCYTPAGQVVGLTNADGGCAPGLVLPEPTPMIHVWLEPQECGPFSALEGIGGGQIAEGETVLCDHAHGPPPADPSGQLRRVPVLPPPRDPVLRGARTRSCPARSSRRRPPAAAW